MAFLKFNKAELVNLSYSLKREIICANKTGAYCNTSIVTCNTRRYHGLLALTLDRFGGDRFLMLSSLDESIIVEGKRFIWAYIAMARSTSHAGISMWWILRQTLSPALPTR